MIKFGLFHGTGGDKNCHWFPWLTKELSETGAKVFCPTLPDSDTANLEVWSKYVLENISLHEDLTLLGHSAGVPLILHLLNTQNIKIKRVILVGGFALPLAHMEDNHPTLPKNLDWPKLKDLVKDVYIINSDNDPWGCDDKAGAIIRKNLGGRQIITTGEGHYGSEKFKQIYTEFPLLKALCLLP